jgi:hypothetical protein
MWDATLERVENIEVGDLVLGPDSKPRRVLKLHRGRQEMARISPRQSKGAPFIVNADHILPVMTLAGSHVRRGSRRSPLNFDPKCSNVSFQCVRVRDIPHLQKKSPYKKFCLRHGYAAFFPKSNSLKVPAYDAGLEISQSCERIPYECKISSWDDRLNILAAVLDSHGVLAGDCRYYLTGSSKRFIHDVAFVARSLGFAANIEKLPASGIKSLASYPKHELLELDELVGTKTQLEDFAAACSDTDFPQAVADYAAFCKAHHIVARQDILDRFPRPVSKGQWRVGIFGATHKIPCRKNGLQALVEKANPLHTQFDIEFLPEDDYFGFELDGDHLYLTSDFIVHHNSGKSAIAMTVARYLLFKELQNGFVATPLKTLQNQYGNDPYFVDHLAVVKGRSAYKCAVSGTHSPACSCKGKKARDMMRATCKSQGICTYYNAIHAAQNHPLVLHNMASLIFQCAPLGFYFDSRDLLILDECHCAEDNLLEMFGFTFNQKFCDKYKFQVGMPSWGADGATEPTYEEVLQWLEGAQKSLVTYRAHNENHMTEAEDKTITNRLGNMSLCLRNPEEWVADLKPDEMIFKPLDVSKKADLIYGKARYRLWMSATILGKENFARSMGLSPKKCHYIEAPSTFPAVNRPIYAMECFGIRKLNRDKLDAEMPKLIDAIDAIIDQYPQEKGLIHTHTYKILHALINNSKHRHRMRFHDSTNREDVLGDFLRSPDNDILVSPSMVEGIDLKDDLGRFQILCKIPWPYLGDAQIRALKDHRDGWYLWKTSLEVVQACGRIVRHDTDWGHTYVLDPDFRRWFSNAKELLPDYFKRSVKFVKEF